MTQRLDATWQKWSEPKNLGPAINTEGHETGFFLSPDKTTAYFSASDAQLKTSANIFRITVPEPAPEEVEQVIAETNTKKMTEEEINAMGTEKVTDDGVLLDLHVFDPLTKIPFREELILVDNITGAKVATLRPVDEQGHFKTRAPLGKVYKIQSANEKVILSSKPLDLRERPSNNVFNEEIPILVTVDGDIVRLRDVVFQFNDVSVQESAKNQLDNFADFMIKYPSVKAEVGGHTDNVGSDEVNLRFSRQRAENVMKYLIDKGVSRQQLTFKGFGKAVPINDNSTEALRLANRRVEFKIVQF
jgi:outer membrane protein OmpA-like peptidoglycan-associated protein